jgi:hypothetical protein
VLCDVLGRDGSVHLDGTPAEPCHR